MCNISACTLHQTLNGVALHMVAICWLTWNYQFSHFPSLKHLDFHLGIHVPWEELTPHLSLGVWHCI